MPEPKLDPNDKEQQPILGEGPWNDKVLVDAIGYTKGLVAILDSLTDGFQRRGREIEEQRHRLAILQSERRAIQEGRAEFEAQIGTLTAERDGLRATLEGRNRDLEQLRQEVAQGQAALDTRLREIQELQAGMAEPARQAEELREVVRALERQLQKVRQAPGPSSKDESTPDDPLKASYNDLVGLQELISDYQRSGEAEVAGLTAERDGLRAEVEARDREIERLRQEVAQGQVALDARLGEIRELQVRVAEPARQAEELREIVRGLQRERDSLTHRQAILDAELEEERRQAREAAARATQAQAALREDLADAESILAGLRKDIAGAQGLTTSLRRTAEEERSRAGLLQEQLRFQTVEVARLTAAIQGAQTLLGELDDALGGELGASRLGWEPSTQRREWSELAGLVEGSEGAANLGRDALTMLQPVFEGLRGILGPADGAAIQLPRSAADQAPVRQRAQQIADRWRQLLRERADSTQRERQLREENERLSAELATTKDGRDARRDDQRSTPTRDRRAPAGEAVAPHGAGEKTLRRGAGSKEAAAPIAAVAPAAPQKALKRRAALSGMTVECTLETSGGEAARILRGEIVRINTMGLMGAFEEQFPEGRRVAVRFVRGGEEFTFPGRIVRVQPSVTTPDAPPVFNHLIRFESPAAKPDA